MRFENKVAIITGAASGIGRALSERLAAEGACVALIDRNEDGLAAAAAALPDASKVWYRALDIADEGEVERCVGDV
ncbi:SDR family NAD(P)-dependent oxidoreductase, partial [Rhodoferax sp. UBA5149]|uniref:SDR family NAD(P)-dependent oxidoreductase n=1 Tax=Rhodoferax sp. UBA5149 TaxID=1947379 RepID=UPI0025F3DA02